MRYSETLEISMLENDGRETWMQSKLNSLVSDGIISNLNDDPKNHLKPNPAKSNPSDWDLAFIETPRINLKN